jgi:hypothetical protein
MQWEETTFARVAEPRLLTQAHKFCQDSMLCLEFFGEKKMKHGNAWEKTFIAAIAFFWPVSLLKKSQKKNFGDRISPTAVAEKWCPAL